MDIKEFQKAISKEVTIYFGETKGLDPEDVWITFRQPTQAEKNKLQFAIIPETVQINEGKETIKEISKNIIINRSKVLEETIKATIVKHSFMDGEKPVANNKVWAVIQSDPETYEEIVSFWNEQYITPLAQEVEKE